MTGMLPLLGLVAACFAKVFLAAMQTKNVVHSKYIWMFMTSLLMTVADVFYVKIVATHDIIQVILVGGLTQAFAVVIAVWVFDKAHKRKV